jgi:glycerate kinase
MIDAKDLALAKATLEKSKEEVIREMARCGSAGGVGRVSAYAPQLVAIETSIQIVDDLLNAEAPEGTPVAEMTDAQLRAANARAAKAAKQ